MGGAHAQRFKANPDARIVALCDVKKEIVEAFIEKHLKDYAPRPTIYTDAAAMYREAKPDGVAIVTPHTQHFEQALQALSAGCHVLMDKPMVTQADQAYTLADKVKATGKVFLVGYNTSCSPEFYYLRETIRNKTLGNLEMVIGYISQDWMRFTKGLWRQDPKLSGGGQAYDSGAHLLNSLCWSVEANVAEVFAFVDNHGTPVDINSTFVVKFENGVMASIAVSGNCPSGGTHMVFIFDGGRVEIDGWGGSWINVFKGNEKIKYPVIPWKAQTPNDNFIDAILGRAEPRATVLNGIVHTELMDAIYESARTGQPARPKRRG
jgi:predicted dehydrogenase